MKIIHIVRRYGPVGGMERYVWETSQEMVKLGHEVQVICEHCLADKPEGIVVHELGKMFYRPRWLYYWRFSRRVGKWLRAHPQPGWLIHSHERVGVHHITTFHSPPFASIRERAWWKRISLRVVAHLFLERRELRVAKCIVPNSEIISRQLAYYYPEYAHKLTRPVVPGVLPGIGRATRSVPDDGGIIGFVGLEWRRKGLPLAVKIVELLRRERPELELRVIGPKAREVRHLFRDWRGGYRLFGWRKDPGFFCEIDVLLHPAKVEPYGMVISEAMAAGVPVVVSDACGAAAQVKSDAGRVVKLAASAAQWADAVASQLGRADPIPLFTRGWDTVAREYLETYTGASCFRRRKIAVVVPKYGLVGGGERFTSEITGRLVQNKDFEIHVLANRWVSNSERIQFHKIPMFSFPRYLRPLMFAWIAQWMIKRIGFDLVHTHHWIFHADIFSAHGVPHAGWVRDVRMHSPSLYDRAVIVVENKLMRENDQSIFLPVSSLAMEAFRKEYSKLPGQWRVMHPGVEVDKFAKPDRKICRAEIRQQYGIREEELLLLFVGMNFEVKGLDTIIAALAKARSVRPEANIRLLVVGRGNEGKFHGLARSLGIVDAVVFAGTQVAGLERYYKAADAFIMLSRFDTFGMVVLEAMAAGLPVIVSPNVGAKDIVEEDVNGYILPTPRDAETAADRIISLSDGARRAAMGMAAEASAARHDWARLTEKMDNLYRDALSRKTR